MKTRSILASASIVLLLAAGASAGAAEATGRTAPASSPSKGQAPAALKVGATADEVRQLFGKPDEIRPMEAPNGKAEVWVFVKELRTRVERIGFPSPAITSTVTSADGTTHQFSTPGDLIYHDVHYVTEETTEVLMFNDHFVAQKASRKERQQFQ